MKQTTFMMLKPDAFTKDKQTAIIDTLQKHGLIVEKSKEIEVDMDIMKILLEHYHEVIDQMSKDFNFPGKLFNTFYYDGPHKIMPMKIIYEGAESIIPYSRALIGKTNPQDADRTSIRGMYSDDNYDKAGADNRLVNNLIHASDSEESALRELAIWQAFLL